jgi:hypothetical protein
MKKTKDEEHSTADAVEGAREQIPEDFPDELRPHARAVLPILRTVAKQHNAKAVSALALARTMMGRPRKPFVRAAHDFSAWAADPPRPIRDVVASYRTWLDREHDLADVERIGAAVPPRRGRQSSDDFEAKLRERLSGGGGTVPGDVIEGSATEEGTDVDAE